MTKPYIITHTDIDTAVETILTDDVITIPIFTDNGSDEINTARIVLSADQGKYITSAPILDQFDRIRIFCEDPQGLQYNKVFDIKRVIPIESKSEGTRVQLDLVGLEQHFQRMFYVGPRYFTNAFTMVKDIGTYYMANKGAIKQPVLTGHDVPPTNPLFPTNNGLPNYTINTYDFGLNQETCYNRNMQVLDKLGGSVDAGGILDYFEMKFVSSSSSVYTMRMDIFSSGSLPKTTPITIVNSDSVNVGDSEAGFDDMRGNVVYAWGEDDQGSLPTDFSKYKSAQQLFPLHPVWDSINPYLIGSKVQTTLLGITKHFKRIDDSDITPILPNISADWQEITTATEFGDVIDYSPWTRGKSPEWTASVAHPGGSIGVLFGQSMWDSNLVVFDEKTSMRIPVDVAISDGGGFGFIPTQCLFDGKYAYRGMRVLLLGDATGIWSGDDEFGNPMAKQVLEFNGDTLRWFVKYPDLLGQENVMVGVVQNENFYDFFPDPLIHINAAARVLKFDGIDWQDISGETNGNDCFHPFESVINVDGIPDNSFGSTYTDKNFKSAIEATFQFNPVEVQAGAAGTASSGHEKDYYECGAWLDLQVPLPINTIPVLVGIGGVGGNVGYLYGGSGATATNVEPCTLDIENMNRLPDGTIGFNQDMSESYGHISDMAFFMKIDYEAILPDSSLFTFSEGNFKVRATFFDTDDNTIVQDYVVSHNGKFEEFHLPVSGFTTYRGRRPKQFSDIFIPVKQQDAQNIFIWRNLKRICWQLQESYDNEGRFSPHVIIGGFSGRYTLIPNGVDIALNPAILLPTTDRRLRMTIDGLRFTKPLLVGSGVVTDRDIEVDFIERRNIGNYYQLKGDVLAELEKSQFRKTSYDITTSGKFDIGFGHSFYFTNPRIVPFSDNGANTVKLVAKKITYSLTKPVGGEGGFLRTIHGVRRFT